MKNKYSLGVLLALATALISGFSNFIMKYSVSVVKNPIVFTTLKNALVAGVFIGIFLLLRKWREIRNLKLHQWSKLMLIGLIGGSVPFILYFTALSQTSAVTASFIHKTLFIWVALMAIPFLKEKLSWLQGAALGLLLTGSIFLGGFSGFQLNTAELMILIATILWAIENLIAKHMLQEISSTIIGGFRMILGSLVLSIVVWQQGNLSLISGLNSSQWLWTIIPALLLSCYILCWYSSLKHLPVTIAASLLVPAALVTNVLSAIFISHTFPARELLGAALIIISLGALIYPIWLKWKSLKLKPANDHNENA